MGTNYYLHKKVCPTCGKPEKEIHIGKSSMGWRFTFRYYKGEITCIQDWIEQIEDSNTVIKDEYGENISKFWFWKMVHMKEATTYKHPNHTHIFRDGGDLDIDGYRFADYEFS